VNRCQSGRYISSNEAAWRIFDFTIHNRYSPVQHLSVHLAEGQRVYFTEANFEERASNPSKTILNAFFDLCQKDDFARGLLYCDIPKYYKWNSQRKMWNWRKQGTPVPDHSGVRLSDTVGRVYTVHPLNFRVLLQAFASACSQRINFANLRTMDGQHVKRSVKHAPRGDCWRMMPIGIKPWKKCCQSLCSHAEVFVHRND
jgi:hypothetical protein